MVAGWCAERGVLASLVVELRTGSVTSLRTGAKGGSAEVADGRSPEVNIGEIEGSRRRTSPGNGSNMSCMSGHGKISLSGVLRDGDMQKGKSRMKNLNDEHLTMTCLALSYPTTCFPSGTEYIKTASLVLGCNFDVIVGGNRYSIAHPKGANK